MGHAVTVEEPRSGKDWNEYLQKRKSPERGRHGAFVAIGTVFVQLILGPNAFITGRGFAKMGMTTVLIGAVANIVLDPIFLFALKLGVQGAVLATVLLPRPFPVRG